MICEGALFDKRPHETKVLVAENKRWSCLEERVETGVLCSKEKGMRSSHEDEACDMKCASEDSFKKDNKLCNVEPLAKSDFRV